MGRPVVTLAPGVHRIPTLGDFINSYVFVDPDGSVTLVDTGLRRAPATIVRGLAALGLHPSDVTRILLTHGHFDHAGGAARMVRETGLPGVEVHERDAEFVERGTPPPTDKSRLSGRLLERAPTGGFAGTPVVHLLTDGEVVDVAGGLRVVHTPGHTPGHISLLHEDSGVLITGDAIFNMNSRLSWPFAAACTDFAQTQETAAVLGDLDYSVAAFTHGPEIRERAREQVRGFLSRRR
jgi:glyoxylase-like metal-dependent hydrolase (beta-lactamase superfamily II)